tara:strand:- start:13788 stop:14081 length:294 start_codon:yes stop_codon:yes gene_type:complete
MAFANPPSNTTNLINFVTHANSITDGWFGLIVLISIFTVSMIAMKGKRTTAAFAAAMFGTSLMGILLRVMDVLNDRALFACFVLLGVAVVALMYDSN